MRLLGPPRGSWRDRRAPGLRPAGGLFVGTDLLFLFLPKDIKHESEACEMIHWKFSSKRKKKRKMFLDWSAEPLAMPGRHLAAALPPGAQPLTAPGRADLALRHRTTRVCKTPLKSNMYNDVSYRQFLSKMS